MAAPLLYDFTTGQRIRYYRERLGLKQKVVAELVGKSENWLYKIENGQIPCDRISVLINLARVLRVEDLSDLTGGFLSGAVDGGGSIAEHPSVPEIRRILTRPTMLLGADLDTQPLTPAELAKSVEEARTVYNTQTIRYGLVGDQLPQLLEQGYSTMRSVAGQEPEISAIRSVVSVYSLFEVWLRRVGEFGLARIAADRAMVLAESTGDPVLRAAAAWKLACVLTSSGNVQDSVDLTAQMIAACAPGDDASPEHLSVYGALHLQGAVAAVRANRSPLGWDLLRRADVVAQRIGGDRNDWNTCFGVTNVAMHGVHLAAEEGDAAEALRRADDVHVSGNQPIEREARYLLELVNCNRIQKDDYATVFLLRRIMDLSPEEIVFSPLAREAVSELLKREKPMWGPELRVVGRHIGMVE